MQVENDVWNIINKEEIMAKLKDIMVYCDERVNRREIVDLPGAENGLQFENNGEVRKIGAAVDAGLKPFKKACEAGVDFLIVHHGLFWQHPKSITGVAYEKYKLLFDSNLAVYGSHLPLDGHREIGNNAVIVKRLELKAVGRCFKYEGFDIGYLTEGLESREELSKQLKALFPKTYMGIEKGSEKPERIAISSGSGIGVLGELKKLGVDTLITGELKQHAYNMAEEEGWNLYPCGHYATEVFGVQELAKEVAEVFDLEWELIETECLL